MSESNEAYSFEETSRYAEVAGLRLHYNDLGDPGNDTLVMLHGGGPGATGWSNFKQNFPAFASKFRVLVVDQPHFGLSGTLETDEQFNVLSARAILGLLDELEIPRAHFLGNSLGGGSSMRFAIEYPDRADRLVLMGPGNSHVPVLTANPTEGLKTLFNFMAPPGPTPEKMEQFLRVMVYDQSLITDELIEERFKMATAPSVLKGMANFGRTAMGANEEGRLKAELWRDVHKIKHRTLITWGREDRVLPLEGGLFAFRQMENASLHVLPRCGHWAQVEHAREFERLSIDFLTAP